MHPQRRQDRAVGELHARRGLRLALGRRVRVVADKRPGVRHPAVALDHLRAADLVAQQRADEDLVVVVNHAVRVRVDRRRPLVDVTVLELEQKVVGHDVDLEDGHKDHRVDQRDVQVTEALAVNGADERRDHVCEVEPTAVLLAHLVDGRARRPIWLDHSRPPVVLAQRGARLEHAAAVEQRKRQAQHEACNVDPADPHEDDEHRGQVEREEDEAEHRVAARPLRVVVRRRWHARLVAADERGRQEREDVY
mmetsp:Transcript_23922/g.61627  ORF Transcript_23922/g.61627 Transcript_23922/m.61627 type:complete len:251 (-) Transcript_23922:204-956(-)